jgi:alcohol dehydrogenase YqhD (iron-dependent ADH family)
MESSLFYLKGGSICKNMILDKILARLKREGMALYALKGAARQEEAKNFGFFI